MIKKEDVPFAENSDWNMGVHYYVQLAYLKEKYMYYFEKKDVKKAVSILTQEIDWVNLDFGEDKLKEFRRRIDNLRNQSIRNLSDGGKNNILANLNVLKRQVWDMENSLNITRPKDNMDNTDVSVTRLNRR